MKESKIDKYIGETFKDLREKHNYSLADVGDRIGIGRQTYYKYECGKRSMPYSVMQKLGSLYDYDVVELIAEIIEKLKDGSLSD